MTDALPLAQVVIHQRTGESCVAQNKLFCPDWAIHNLDRYTTPTEQHLILVGASVVIGFAIAFGLALLSHRRRWLQQPLIGVTGVLYTVPSIAFFFLLLPLTGFGKDTAIIALTAYTLQIIYRNVLAGLANVPHGVTDAARGMGLTDRQLLWRIELPLAVPEIIAGLRIATVSTVALATLAVFAGGGDDRDRDGNGLRRDPAADTATHDTLAASRMTAATQVPLAFLGQFGNAFDFIAHGKEAATGGVHVGGPDQVLDLTLTHLEVTGLAMLLALVVALPVGLLLGHYGRGELPAGVGGSARAGPDLAIIAVGIGNAGRAVPELAIIALTAAAIGVGLVNVTFALAVLAIPPILTNTFVAIRQVDRRAVESARAMGMTTSELLGRVELPLAVPTIMGGVRTATINVVATATIAPLAGVLTLGDFILSRNVYGDEGVIAGAICVALLALILEAVLAGVQHLLTPRGLRLARASG